MKFPTLSFFLTKICSPDCHVLSVACRWWANYALANKSTASLLFAYTVFWDYYFLLCHRYNEIRVRYYYMLFVDTRMRRGYRWERVVLLIWFSSCSYRNRFAVCLLFARLKPSAPEVNPDNMSKATDGILCTVNIMCIYVPTLSFKINRLTVKRARRFY